MPTTFNFDLSTTLENTLKTNGAGNGVYAYAFAFGTPDSGPDAGQKGSLMAQVTLVDNGTLVASPSFQLTSFPSGVVYVVIQQNGDGTLPAHIAAGVDQNGTNPMGVITPADSASNNYAYQLFETSLGNSANDVGDISALNTFGLTSTLEVVFQDGTSDHRGFRSSANTIFGEVSGAVEAYSPNIFPTSNRLGIGPASQTGDFPATYWTDYVNALAGNAGVLNDIQIVATYGGGGVQATPMLSVYGVEYEASSDSFWLVPDITHGGTNTNWINIPRTVLIDNIYTQPTDLVVHQGSKTGPVVTVVGGGFTPNNAAGTVSRDFVAGFDAGYWGGSGTSPNPLVSTPINLNQNSNWNVNYAYEGTLNLTPGLVTVTNALSSHAYDLWAQAIQNNGNAYGWSYSDLASNGGINPQITLWDATVTPNTQVQTINIKLFDNGETPPDGSFLTPPPVYVAPPAGGYKPALTTPSFTAPYGYASEIGFSFNFNAGILTFAPYLDTPITFKFYAPGSPQAGADGFVSLDVSGPNGAWYDYTVVNDGGPGGTWSLRPDAEHTTAGSFNLFNLPTTADDSTSWYQLEFGSPGNETLYNLYASSGSTSGLTHTLTDVVIDRAVSVTTTAETSNTSNYFSLNFAPGGSLTYDVDNLPARARHDINADGLSDLVFQNTDGTVFGWEQNATGTMAAGQIGTPDPSWQAKQVADFYGDGGADILFQNSATSEVYLWKQDGFAISTAGSIGAPGLEWQVKGAGDINGDGAADIIFQNSSTGDVFGWEQHGLSTIVGGAGTIGTPGTQWQVKGVADFTADGKSDIVFQNSGTGEVAIWNLNGLAIASTTILGNPGTVWQVKGTGDINGDGYADLVFQNSTSGDVFAWELGTEVISNVTYNDIVLAGTIGTPGVAWQVAGTGDFNGDGMTDIAFRNSTTGAIYEWQQNGLQISQAISLGDPGLSWHIV